MSDSLRFPMQSGCVTGVAMKKAIIGTRWNR